MARNNRTVTLLVPLIASALVGLIVLQGYLLNSAFELKEQAFERNVRTALSAASMQLQAGEAISQMFRQGEPLKRMLTTEVRTFTPGRRAGRDSSYTVRASPDPVQVVGNAIHYRIGSPQRVRLHLSDGMGHDSLLVDTLKPAGNHVFIVDSRDTKGGGNFFYRFTTDSVSMVVRVSNGSAGSVLTAPSSEKERAVFVSRVADNLWVSETQPLERRVSPAALDSVLKRTMGEAGLPLSFSYGILSGRGATGDSIHWATPPGSAPELRSSAFQVPLSPFDPVGPEERLVVHFPGRSLYLLRQLGPALVASMVFIALIVVAFVSTIRTIMRQQRLSGQMVEFINNMTHEFKTPISTVALASEAIGRPDVLSRKAKVLQYNRMIGEETSRMRKQVDRILQLAQLEEGDIELSWGDVDMHDLIRRAAGNFTLQVEARGGRILTDLRATSAVVRGDSVHLANVVGNLLDNANKYSPAAPEIRVATKNDGGILVVSVSDRGTGIPAEHQQRVFDKFYRVPTGNLHDVKGFGIGLSSVKLLVEAHGGTVVLSSEPGEGTEVSLRLPLRG